MQRLEVSGAVRHIYIIRRLKVKGRTSNRFEFGSLLQMDGNQMDRSHEKGICIT